jgi:hypothetical protein
MKNLTVILLVWTMFHGGKALADWIEVQTIYDKKIAKSQKDFREILSYPEVYRSFGAHLNQTLSSSKPIKINTIEITMLKVVWENEPSCTVKSPESYQTFYIPFLHIRWTYFYDDNRLETSGFSRYSTGIASPCEVDPSEGRY